MENCVHQCKNLFKRMFLGGMMRYLLVLYLLAFGFFTASAEKMNFYDKKEKLEPQEQTSSNFSLFKNKELGLEDNSSFDLYGKDPLKAPPGGGGDPIGAPISDGVWALCLLAAGYTFFQYKRALKAKLAKK